MVVDIYNRLGQPVYHSVGYAQPWDGTSNGKPVPFGVYYFVIDTKELEQKVTGYVTVIR
jgi:large repetitive protein